MIWVFLTTITSVYINKIIPPVVTQSLLIRYTFDDNLSILSYVMQKGSSWISNQYKLCTWPSTLVFQIQFGFKHFICFCIRLYVKLNHSDGLMAFMINGQHRRKTLAGSKTIHKSHKSLKQNTLSIKIYLFTVICVKVYNIVDCLFSLVYNLYQLLDLSEVWNEFNS